MGLPCNLRRRRQFIIGALAVAAPVAAQQADSAARPPRLTGDVGLVNAAGNSSVTTFHLGERIEVPLDGWRLAQAVRTVYGTTEGVQNANEWHALLRGDRALGARVSVYLLSTFDRNPFAGLTRRFEEGAGIAVRVLRAARDSVSVEAGGSYSWQHSSDTTSTSFPSARAAATYTHAFAAHAYAAQSVEILPDLEVWRNLRINSTTELVAPLSSHLALKLSYDVRFDNLPPPGFRTTDRLLTTGLQIAF